VACGAPPLNARVRLQGNVVRFPQELETAAHRTAGGEYAWPREEALAAARCLADSGAVILGGELWIMRGQQIFGALPQVSGPPGIYHWETVPKDGETRQQLIARACAEACAAIRALPAEGEVAMPEGGAIYYNLTWRH
jgi:hypothetical protein